MIGDDHLWKQKIKQRVPALHQTPTREFVAQSRGKKNVRVIDRLTPGFGRSDRSRQELDTGRRQNFRCQSQITQCKNDLVSSGL